MSLTLRDPVSGLTHLLGLLIALLGLYLLTVSSLLKADSEIYLMSNILYGCSLIAMYLTSSSYHLLNVKPETTLLLRKFDHMAIFALIAGTYTPFCLIVVKGGLGYGMCIFVWSLAVFGALFKIFWLHAPRWLYTLIYIFMGWLGLALAQPILEKIPAEGFAWLVGGGLFYTFGAVIYGTKRPNPFPGVFGFHEIWHLFVMAGSFSHFWCVYQYV